LINQERLLACFMELVKVDSESGFEGQMAATLKDKLTKLGLAVVTDNAAGKTGAETGNLIAGLPGNTDGGPTLMFSAHMDTIAPGCGINPLLENGIIRSAGATVLGADDKAGIAAIIEAVTILQEEKLPHGSLQLVFTVCEETGLSGAKNLDFSLLDADMGFVLDCGDPPGTIINRGPSQDKFKAEVLGKAAHAGSSPEQGINAIQIASRAITRMQLGRLDEETTANIGVITGGIAINVVPDRVTLQGETRSLQDEKRIKQTKAICDILQETTKESGGRLLLKVETIYPAMHVAEEAPVIKLALQAAQQTGLTAQIRSTGGGSDAHIFNERGIPCVNLGIGMQKPHTTEEFIKVADLLAVTDYVLAIIQAAAGGKH